MAKLLIVEDNNKFRTTLRTLLRSSDYSIADVETGEEGLDYARENDIDLLLVDLVLPGINGLEMLDQMKGMGKSFKSILMSAYLTDGIKEKANEYGITDFLEKPFEIIELKEKIRQILGK